MERTLMEIQERLDQLFGSLILPSPAELSKALDVLNVNFEDLSACLGPAGVFPYHRKLLFKNDQVEVLVMNWASGQVCSPHDHGESFGLIEIVTGVATHHLYTLNQIGSPVQYYSRVEAEKSRYFTARNSIHAMGNMTEGLLVTLHVYAPPIYNMKVYDLEKCAACVVSDDCGAWWPAESRQILKQIRLRRVPAS